MRAKIESTDGGLIINDGANGVPFGQYTVHTTKDSTILRAFGGGIVWTLTPSKTMVDGEVFGDVKSLAKKLNSFNDGGGDGSGVTWDEVTDKPLYTLGTPIQDAEGLIPVYTQKGQLPVGMPEFPENAVPLILLDVRAPELEEGNFLVGGEDGNEQRRIVGPDLGVTQTSNNWYVVRWNPVEQKWGGTAQLVPPSPNTSVIRTSSGQGKFSPAVNTDEAVVLSQLDSSLENKVDKEAGKGLSEDNFTTDEKLKLSGLESPKFKGQFLSLADLNSADVGEVGGYAYVDGGAGGTVDLYIWDVVNSLWEIVAGEPTAETPASIKSKYESNPDTNVLTDTEKQALNNMLSDDRFSLKRLGTWNASTNTPQLLQGEGTRGDYRVVTTPGSYNFGNGLINFNYGDWVIFTGGIWHKIVTSDSVVNWNDVQNKPNIPASPRGNISAAIPALRKGLNSPQSIPANTNTRISAWGAGYDQFSLEDTNGIFIMPDWASYARVTCGAILDFLQVGRFFHLELRLNTTSTANSACAGVGTSKKPTVLIDTGIIPVSPGDEFSAVVWHNADTAKPLEAGARTMINIELFETI